MKHLNKLFVLCFSVLTIGLFTPMREMSVLCTDSILSASAAGEEAILEYENCGTYARVVGLSNKTMAETAVIAPTYEGLPVTEVAACAFYYAHALRCVTLPEGIERISFEAFAYCDALSEINLPGSLTEIDNGAFNACISLPRIEIPAGITRLQDAIFEGCTALEEVILPDTLTEIGSDCFNRCTALKTIHLPEGLTAIGDCVFDGCYELTSLTFPASLREIGYDALDSTGWKRAQIEAGEPFIIVNGILLDAPGAAGAVSIPQGIWRINDCAFSTNTEITSVQLPTGLREIGSHAFSGAENLQSVSSFPEGLERIEWGAFERCKSLKSVVLPGSLKVLEASSFVYCTALEAVTFLNPACEISNNDRVICNVYSGHPEDYAGVIYGYEHSTAQTYAEKYGSTFVSLGEAPVSVQSIGDLNSDAQIDTNDAFLVLQYFAGVGAGTAQSVNAQAADLSGDGIIDTYDAYLILSYFSYHASGGTGRLEDWLERI